MLSLAFIVEAPLHNITSHWDAMLESVFVLSAVGHMVSTFPTPQNKYGAWLLGCAQWIVGQRIAAMNTMKGEQSVVTAVRKTEDDGK